MIVRSIPAQERDVFDAVVPHPLQSFAWGEFREKTGTTVERVGIFEDGKIISAYQVTFHPIPLIGKTAGYFPKGIMPDERMMSILADLAKRHDALFIKLEPNIAAPIGKTTGHDTIKQFLQQSGCVPGKPLFTPYSFILSLEKSEEDLLGAMHQKTRYNIGVAQRKGVQVVEDTTEQGLEEYLTLMLETTKRQQFYAHDVSYYRTMFATLAPTGMLHIFKAVYDGKTLSVWIVFLFHDVLYYPYGASSREYREVMANNLLAWEVIKYGKAKGCKSFDMWGSLGPEPDKNDPWYGFHRFKEGYGGELHQFIGTFDLVFDDRLYKLFRTIDAWRWKFLRLRSALKLR